MSVQNILEKGRIISAKENGFFEENFQIIILKYAGKWYKIYPFMGSGNLEVKTWIFGRWKSIPITGVEGDLIYHFIGKYFSNRWKKEKEQIRSKYLGE